MLSPSATNLILFDKSYEAHCLGHASLISIITTINLLLLSINEVIQRNKKGGSRPYYPHIKRKRRTLQSLKREYGSLFQRAYRMDYIAFKSLHRLLQEGIQEYIINEREINDGNNGLEFYMRNGRITTEIRLACALRYFAGGSYLDITLSHGIGKTDLYRSIWAVIHATNACLSLQFCFPTTTSQCQSIASEFANRSKAGFRNCIGCIDGMLVWTEKPSKKQCLEVGVDDGKFYCGRKGKFGLNLQAVCDARCRFTYISLQHPASASDYLAFVTYSLYGQLTEGDGLPPGYCLYGDNAYVNESYMAVPFQATANGLKDSYNFYHSQVRINIECSFGILTNRWRLLKTPLSAKISISRINALISCLCKLHNFCIDNGNARPPERYSHDALTLMDFMDSDESEDSESPRPIGLLGGGEHFADVSGGRREQIRLSRHQHQRNNNAHCEFPRNTMLEQVTQLDIHRPRPF